MKTSTLEHRFIALWNRRHLMGLPPRVAELPDPEREYMFHGHRRWRFDFAWPAYKVAVEMEGGIFTGGRHVRGQQYAGDCHKYNCAVLLGWKLLRFTAVDTAGDPIDMIKQVAEALRQGRIEGCSEQLQMFR